MKRFCFWILPVLAGLMLAGCIVKTPLSTPSDTEPSSSAESSAVQNKPEGLNTPADLYPAEAFNEAIRLTAGMPYKKRSGVRLTKKKVEEVAPEKTEEIAEEVVIDTEEYQKLVDNYTDKNGRLSYDLLNRDLIRFAHSSKTVSKMLEEGESLAKTRTYIICTKFRTVIGNKKLTEAEIRKMAELIDDVSPKSAFKALDSELRKMSAAKKQK